MAFTPPSASSHLLQGINFATATNFAPDVKAKFDAKDNLPKETDPSKCKVLLKFPGVQDPVFWSSKMAIDADGPAADGDGHRSGSELDPGSGQDQTSFEPYGAGGLSAEFVRYIVLPEKAPGVNKPFDPILSIGDLAIVIYKGNMTTAVCGDLGPFNKIGEASIAVHAALMGPPGCPDPCSKRDPQGHCEIIRNSSVDEDVLFFVFPGSSITGTTLSYANINNIVQTKALALFNSFCTPTTSPVAV